MDTKEVKEALALEECKKVIELMGEIGIKANNINWRLVAEELGDIDSTEKKELITTILRKLLAGLLVIIGT